MSLATPRRPWTLAAAAAAAWLVLTVVATTIGGESVAAGVAKEGASTAAAASLAVATGGGLLGWWQHREWRNRTQWVAVDLVDRTMRRLANVAAATFDVADAAVPGTRSIVPLSQVFTLRWSAVRKNAVHQDAATLRTALMDWASSDRAGTATTEPAGPSAAPRGLRRARTATLQERADALWDTVQELSAYLDDQHGPRLLTVTGELHAAVRDVADPIPGDSDTGSIESMLWMLVAVQLGDVVHRAEGVAAALDDAYGSLRSNLSDRQLLDRLEASERAASSHDDDLRAMLEAHSQGAAEMAAFAAQTTDYLAHAAQIAFDCKAILDDPTSTREDRRIARDGLAQVEALLASSEESMRTAIRPTRDRDLPPT